jgi:hypothetical protein
MPSPATVSVAPLRTVDQIARDAGFVTAGPRLQPVNLSGMSWEATALPSTARSTSDVLDLLRSAGASEATIASILAPFPVIAPATYEEAGGEDAAKAEVAAPAGAPVVAAARGTVQREPRDLSGRMTVRLVGADGTRYTYAGLDPASVLVDDGEAMSKGQPLGVVGGRLGIGPPGLRFGLTAADGGRLLAVGYLDRWLTEAIEAAEAYGAAAQGVYAPLVAPAEHAATAAAPFAAGPEGGPAARPALSSLVPELATHNQEGTGTIVSLFVLMLAAAGVRKLFRRPANARPVHEDGFLTSRTA